MKCAGLRPGGIAATKLTVLYWGSRNVIVSYNSFPSNAEQQNTQHQNYAQQDSCCGV